MPDSHSITIIFLPRVSSTDLSHYFIFFFFAKISFRTMSFEDNFLTYILHWQQNKSNYSPLGKRKTHQEPTKEAADQLSGDESTFPKVSRSYNLLD